MATIASLIVRIGGDNSGLRKEIEASQRQIKRAFGSDALGASETSLGIIGAIGAAIAGVGAASVKAAADMEQHQIAFTTLLGSAEKAGAYLQQLTDFANKTPFELPGLLSGSRKLLAFGFTAGQTIPILTAIGDAASGLGLGEEGISRLTLAIGQMQAKGKVSADEMLQLTEAGIPAWEILAKKIGVSIPEAMKAAENGMIDSATGIQAIISGMNERFGGMMKNQSDTMIGLFSTVKGQIGTIMREIGAQITDAFNLKEKMQGITNFLQEITDKIKSAGLQEALRQMIPPEVGAGIAAVAAIITMAAIPALNGLALHAALVLTTLSPFALVGAVVGASMYVLWKNGVELSNILKLMAVIVVAKLLPALIKLGEAFIALWTRMGPVGWAIIAITALGTAIYVIYENWEPVLNWMKNAWNTAVNFIADNITVLMVLFWPVTFQVMGIYVAWKLAFNLIEGLWQKFSTFMEGIVKLFSNIFDRIKIALPKFVEAGKIAISNFASAIGELTQKILPEWVSDVIGFFVSLGEKVTGIATKIGNNIRTALTIKISTPSSLADFRKMEDTNNLPPINLGIEIPDVDNLGLKSSGIMPATIAGSKGGKSEAEKEWEELQRKVEQVSEAINREWVQTTHSQLEQLDIWKNEQLKALNEVMAANQNHNADLLKIEAVYSERRRKILEDEEKFRVDVFNQAADMAKALKTKRDSFGLEGSAKLKYDITSNAEAEMDAIAQKYQKLEVEFRTSTAAQQEEYKKAWAKNGIIFEDTQKEIQQIDQKTGQVIKSGLIKTVDFKKQIATEELEVAKDKYQKLVDIEKTGEGILADIQAAYNNSNLEAYKKALNEENAAKLAQLEGQKELMDLYNKAMTDAHLSSGQIAARVGESLYSGLQESIDGLINGTMSWGEAFKSVAQGIISSIVQIMARMAAARIMMTIFPWFAGFPMFSNGGSVLQRAQGGLIEKYASGGAIRGPGTGTSDSIPAMLSNGEYVINARAAAMLGTDTLDKLNQGFIPLEFSTGGRVIDTPANIVSSASMVNPPNIAAESNFTGKRAQQSSGMENPINMHFAISAFDTKGLDRWLEGAAGRKLEKYFVRRGREFAMTRL